MNHSSINSQGNCRLNWLIQGYGFWLGLSPQCHPYLLCFVDYISVISLHSLLLIFLLVDTFLGDLFQIVT